MLFSSATEVETTDGVGIQTVSNPQSEIETKDKSLTTPSFDVGVRNGLQKHFKICSRHRMS